MIAITKLNDFTKDVHKDEKYIELFILHSKISQLSTQYCMMSKNRLQSKVNWPLAPASYFSHMPIQEQEMRCHHSTHENPLEMAITFDPNATSRFRCRT